MKLHTFCTRGSAAFFSQSTHISVSTMEVIPVTMFAQPIIFKVSGIKQSCTMLMDSVLGICAGHDHDGLSLMSRVSSGRKTWWLLAGIL